jgi:hypothetical protein
MNFLRDLIPIGSVRRTHGLEHATIHVLSEHYPYVTFAGRATADGFFIYGNVPTEAIAAAVDEALRRIRAGEHYLAIHPRCGTNFVVAGVLAGLSSFAVSGNRTRPLADRLARVTLASTAAVLLAQPLGPIIQERITTSPELDNLEIKGITRHQWGKVVVHKIAVSTQPVGN